MRDTSPVGEISVTVSFVLRSDIFAATSGYDSPGASPHTPELSPQNDSKLPTPVGLRAKTTNPPGGMVRFVSKRVVSRPSTKLYPCRLTTAFPVSGQLSNSTHSSEVTLPGSLASDSLMRMPAAKAGFTSPASANTTH